METLMTDKTCGVIKVLKIVHLLNNELRNKKKKNYEYLPKKY